MTLTLRYLHTMYTIYQCLAVLNGNQTTTNNNMGKSTATAAAIIQAEKVAFNVVCKCPLTRILGRPTCTQQDKLVEEISDLALECNVTYE